MSDLLPAAQAFLAGLEACKTDRDVLALRRDADPEALRALVDAGLIPPYWAPLDDA